MPENNAKGNENNENRREKAQEEAQVKVKAKDRVEPIGVLLLVPDYGTEQKLLLFVCALAHIFGLFRKRVADSCSILGASGASRDCENILRGVFGVSRRIFGVTQIFDGLLET